jgi:ABC-2 type transport system permease protein
VLRLLSSIYKEFLILIRDKGGLAVIFLMPLVLIIIMALIQDAPFRDFKESQIPLVLVNNDNDTIGNVIENGLKECGIFTISKTIDNKPVTNLTAKNAVAKGIYKIGVVIPSGASKVMYSKIKEIVTTNLSGLGFNIQNEDSLKNHYIQIIIYLDPTTKKTFKDIMVSSIDKFISKIETQLILNTFYKSLESIYPQSHKADFIDKNFVEYKEIYATNYKNEIILTNSVQHNVPAWTMFAMFFIVLPLAGSMIKERDDGSLRRLKIMPGSNFIVLSSKIILYGFVCFLQFIFMFLVGIYILPLLGLPVLQIGESYIAILMVVISTSLAATGYGVMIGTIFKTHQQASTFSAVSIVILAALGGIWVPVIIMPSIMKFVSVFSPLAWGLNAFNDIFLRGGNVITILPDASKLFLFFIINLFIAFIYNKYVKFKS